MSALVALRPQMKKVFEAQNLKFSYLPFLIKAASMALIHYPYLNSSIDDKCENITLKVS